MTPLSTTSPHRTPNLALSSTSSSSIDSLSVVTKRLRLRSANKRKRSLSFCPSLPPSSTSSTSSPRSVRVLDSCSCSDLFVCDGGWVCDGGKRGPNYCCCCR
ncbi:hypothetical protein glysoja_004525 [Glycine soja]|nr:hypothetical protein glysoja_004525 [Glycine soja]